MDRKFMFMEKNLSPGGCLPLPWGYIHVYDHNIQTLMEETYWEHKWTENLCLWKKICPQEVVCPCPGAIYIYMTIIFKHLLH